MYIQLYMYFYVYTCIFMYIHVLHVFHVYMYIHVYRIFLSPDGSTVDSVIQQYDECHSLLSRVCNKLIFITQMAFSRIEGNG